MDDVLQLLIDYVELEHNTKSHNIFQYDRGESPLNNDETGGRVHEHSSGSAEHNNSNDRGTPVKQLVAEFDVMELHKM